MGWSCSRKAGETMDAITKACIASTGSQNVFQSIPGQLVLIETSRREHLDGSITGSTLIDNMGERARSGDPLVLNGALRTALFRTRGGTFKIDGETGDLVRGPAALRRLVDSIQRAPMR